MKIAVSSQGPSPTDAFDERFGRAAYILVYDTTSGEWTVLDNAENREAQGGAGIGAATKVVEAGAELLITGHVGPKAETALQAGGIRTITGRYANPQEAVDKARSELT